MGKEDAVRRKRFSVEQIVAVLKQAEMGTPVSDLIRHLAAVKKRELPGIDAWVKTRVQSKE